MGFITFNAHQNARDMFEEEGLLPANVHPALASSWERSRNYNVHPFIDEAPTASRSPKNDMENFLIQIAKPYFKYFSNLLLLSECVLAFSNTDGVLLHVETQSRELRKYAEKHNFMIDALWNEKSVGTNAITMALSEKINVFLNGYEHYSYGWHPYCCVASPIFHPQSNDVVGVVDLTGFSNKLNMHSIGWVSAVARLIEAELVKHILEWGNKSKYKNISLFHINNNPVATPSPPRVIGNDPAFLYTLKLAEKAAKTDLNVLLTGETGSGKEVFARFIHNNSTRAEGPFVAVNCGAIPKELMTSEFYGYLEGAFTGASKRGHPGKFEQADGGTIFLDEIGDAPYEIQVGLLRVIEEGCVSRLGAVRPTPINVRVLTATSRDLAILVRDGAFRKDLYYRLAGINISVPALRHRREDIPLLAEYFLECIKNSNGSNYVFESELLQVFLKYDWPGNIRELKNTVERLAGLTEDKVLSSELFYHLMPRDNKLYLKSNPAKENLVNAIREAGGNLSRVAEKLGINRSTVYRRMKKYGIEKE